MSGIPSSVPKLKFMDSSFRLSVIPLSIVSLWLTVTNKEDNTVYGNIQFADFIGLKYMASITAIAAAYALIALISSWIQCLVAKAWVFFVFDQVMAYLMVTSGGSAVEFLYLAYNGDVDITWSEACNSYGSFCTRLKMAVVLHFLALLCFLVLAVTSAFRAFSQFQPPVALKPEEGGDEQS